MHRFRRQRDDPGVNPSLSRGPMMRVPKVIRVRRKDNLATLRRETQLRVVGNILLSLPLGSLDVNATRLEKRDEVVIHAFIEIDDVARHYASRRRKSSSTPFFRM